MIDSIPPEKRDEWHTWVAENIGGDEGSIERATNAALRSLAAGGNTTDAIAAARSAATSRTAEGDAGSHPVSDDGHLRGVVSVFRERNELMGSQYGSVWSFRVDQWDRRGTPQPPVSVEMRGLKFTGSIGQGDWVEIAGHWKPGAVLHAHTVKNLSMNAIVTGNGGGSGGFGGAAGAIGAILRSVFFLLVLAFIVYVAWSMLGAR